METPNIDKLKDYGSYYSEESFWKKIGKFAKLAGKKVVYLALLLHYTLQSSQVSVGNKAIIVGALGYLICPIDLIADVIPILGFADDLAALTLAYKAVQTSITPEIEKLAQEKLQQWFG